MGFIGLFLGILLHALHALSTAKVSTGSAGMNPITYFTQNWLATSTSLVASIAMFMGLPELVVAFPDLVKALGLSTFNTGSFLSGFMCGFLGDVIAGYMGERAKKLYGR